MKQCLIIIILLFTASHSEGQFILAGQYNSGDYHVDVSPDLFMAGQHNGPSAIYDMDINGDSITDLTLIAYNFGGLGGGSAAALISTQPNTHIAYGIEDTCFNFLGNMQGITKIARGFAINDTIGPSAIWDTSIALSYSSFLMGSYSCGGTMLNPVNNYLGVRTDAGTDTAYGWIRLRDVTGGIFTLEEYAGNKTAVGSDEISADPISIFPVPSNGKVYINIPKGEAGLTLFDLKGNRVMQSVLTGFSPIDLPAGFFIYYLNTSHGIKTGKLVISGF